MAKRPARKQPAPPAVSARAIALGIGTFLVGTAALAAGAVALAVRRQDQGPEERRADPAAAGRPLVGSAAEQAAASVPSDGAASPVVLTAAADGPVPARAEAREADAPIPGEGHAAPDLSPDAPADTPVPAAFRPDIDAPMSDAEREALRPPIGPSPTLVDAGMSQPAGS